MIRWMPGWLPIALGAALLGLACEDKKPSPDSPRPDASAGTDKYATADPKLEKALRAATAASGATDNGAPPDGIFPAGVADRRHPKGAPTTVDLVGEGDDPRVAMVPAGGVTDSLLASSYGPGGMEIGTQMGRVALPTIDIALSLGPAKKDDGGAEWLVAEVKSATPAKEQLGQLPPGTDKEIRSLEGTQLRIRLTPDGRESDVQVRLGKASHPELERVAQNAVEALVWTTVPLPPKPVGVGAQWIAETRMPLSSLDVIAYRAYRVKSIEGDRLHLALSVKAYAANRDAVLQDMPKGATFQQFDAEAQGAMELVRGESLARKSDVQLRVVMVVQQAGGAQGSPQQPGQPQGGVLTEQIQTQATLVRGDDLRALRRQ